MGFSPFNSRFLEVWILTQFIYSCIVRTKDLFFLLPWTGVPGAGCWLYLELNTSWACYPGAPITGTSLLNRKSWRVGSTLLELVPGWSTGWFMFQVYNNMVRTREHLIWVFSARHFTDLSENIHIVKSVDKFNSSKMYRMRAD